MNYSLDTLAAYQYAVWAFLIVSLFVVIYMFAIRRGAGVVVALYAITGLAFAGVVAIINPVEQQADALYAAVVEDQSGVGITAMGVVDEEDEGVLACLDGSRPGDVEVWLTGENDGYYRGILVNHGEVDGSCAYQLAVS